MQEHTQNYSIIDKLVVLGCNQHVINLDRDFILYVPKTVADNTLEACGITLEKFIEESAVFKLKFDRIDDEKGYIYNTEDLHTAKGEENYYRFKIYYDKEYNKRHYYTFCYIRHLYYCENTLINYFQNYKEDYLEKIQNFNCNGYSIFPGSAFVASPDFYEKYKKNYSNSNFILFSVIQLEDIQKKVDAYNLFTGKTIAVDYNTDKELTLNRIRYNILESSNDIMKKHKKTDKLIPFSSSKGEKVYIYSKLPKKNKQIRILSRHPSHAPLREEKYSKSILFRLGSTTKLDKKYDVYINSIEAIKVTSNKLLMKESFEEAQVATPKWTKEAGKAELLKFPIVAKHIMGSRGTGNYKLDTKKDLAEFLNKKKNIECFIFEEFCSYVYEYRVHVSRLGVFLVWQKLRKQTTSKDRWWVYNNDNCVFISESNPLFVKINIDKLNAISKKALQSVGLDIGSLDIKMNKKGEFKVIEINSAPSLGEVGINCYKNEIQRLCAE
jgi:glutathione synthase/RimK-type ligase-like ATP-grasp enzyme